MTDIVIRSINLRGSWSLDTINDECPICRNSVLELCVECSDSACECVSVMGLCEHIYHLHCIEKWTKTKNSCPLDNKKWEYKKPNICQIIGNKSKLVVPHFNHQNPSPGSIDWGDTTSWDPTPALQLFPEDPTVPTTQIVLEQSDEESDEDSDEESDEE